MHKTAKRVETRKLMRRKSLPKIHKTKLKGRKQVQEAVLNDPEPSYVVNDNHLHTIYFCFFYFYFGFNFSIIRKKRLG